MARPQTEARKIAAEICSKFPEAPSHSLASKLFNEYPEAFASQEDARNYVRTVRGKIGNIVEPQTPKKN